MVRALPVRPVPGPPAIPGRRRFVSALGAAALAALLADCASPPPLPRPLDPSRAPRVGDSWRYGYRSEQRKNVPPATFDIAIISVTAQGITDRLTLAGEAGVASDFLFTSQLALVARPLGSGAVYEFSPYLEAFGPIPEGGYGLTMPLADLATPWGGKAQRVGVEQVTVPAGAFEATRVDIEGWRDFVDGMDNEITPVHIHASAWFASRAKRLVRFTFTTQAQRLNYLSRDLTELLSYQVA